MSCNQSQNNKSPFPLLLQAFLLVLGVIGGLITMIIASYNNNEEIAKLGAMLTVACIAVGIFRSARFFKRLL